MKLDLHVHSAISADAAGTPEEVLLSARRAGLDGIALTEHHCYERCSVFLKLAHRFGMAVFVGAEVATRSGHFLVYSENTGQWSRFNRPPGDAQELIDAVNKAGGAVVSAHPYRMASGLFGTAVQRLRGLAAIESLNGGSSDAENRRAAVLAQTMGLPCTGGSDAHHPAEIGRFYTVFETPVTAIGELAAALKAGRCKAVRGRT